MQIAVKLVVFVICVLCASGFHHSSVQATQILVPSKQSDLLLDDTYRAARSDTLPKSDLEQNISNDGSYRLYRTVDVAQKETVAILSLKNGRPRLYGLFGMSLPDAEERLGKPLLSCNDSDLEKYTNKQLTRHFHLIGSSGKSQQLVHVTVQLENGRISKCLVECAGITKSAWIEAPPKKGCGSAPLVTDQIYCIRQAKKEERSEPLSSQSNSAPVPNAQ